MSPVQRIGWIEGYLVVDRDSGLIRAFRRSVVAAFIQGDRYSRSLIMMVRIPADQEIMYRRAEVSRGPGPSEEEQSRTQIVGIADILDADIPGKDGEGR